MIGVFMKNEREFGLELEKWCKRLNWRYYHTFNSKFSAPDYTLVNKEQKRVVFAELKMPGNKPTERQQSWLDDLAEAGQEVYLWYDTEADWREILSVLRPKESIGE